MCGFCGERYRCRCERWVVAEHYCGDAVREFERKKQYDPSLPDAHIHELACGEEGRPREYFRWLRDSPDWCCSDYCCARDIERQLKRIRPNATYSQAKNILTSNAEYDQGSLEALVMRSHVYCKGRRADDSWEEEMDERKQRVDYDAMREQPTHEESRPARSTQGGSKRDRSSTPNSSGTSRRGRGGGAAGAAR